MKKHILGLLFAVFLVAAMGYSGRLGQIREGPMVNNELEIHYNAINDGSHHIDNAIVTIWIPNLDYFERTSSFDLGRGNKYGGFIMVPRSDVPPGDYFARIMFYSQYSSDSKWMWITLE